MTDKTKEAITRGHKAKSLLENDLLNQYWGDVEKKLVLSLKQTPTANAGRVLELQSQLKAIEDIQKDFSRYMTAGENAKTRLGKENMKDKVKRIIS
jgi:hypothetical protein